MKKIIFVFILLPCLIGSSLGWMLSPVIVGQPVIVAGGFAGYNDSIPDNNNLITTAANMSGRIPAITPTTSGKVRYFHISCSTDISSLSCNAGIYSSNGTTLLVDGQLGNPTSNGSGWYTIQLDSDYSISTGTDISLVFGTTSSSYIYANRMSGGATAMSYRDIAGTVGDNMPADVSGGTAVNYNRFIMYVDNNAGIVP
jgi:hypothetical protein